MDSRTHRRLAALAAGALEPGEALRLQEQIAADPELRRAYATYQPAAPEPGIWTLPPPGLGGGPTGLLARVETLAALDPDSRVLRVRFQAREADPRAVVLLARGEAGWQVWSPERDEAPVLVADLGLDPSTGERELLLSGLAAPVRRLGLVLAPPALLPTVPWGEDPWAALRAALEREEVDVRVLNLDAGGVFRS